MKRGAADAEDVQVHMGPGQARSCGRRETCFAACRRRTDANANVREDIERQHEREGDPELARRVEVEDCARRVHDEADAPLRGKAAANISRLSAVFAGRRAVAEAVVQHGEGEDMVAAPRPYNDDQT